jgi:hypothetical protein
MKCDHCTAEIGDDGFNPDMGGLTPSQEKVAECMNQNEEVVICETCYFEYLRGKE